MLRAVDRVCPMLALAGDRRTAVDGVDGGHRCHAEDPPGALERSMQAQLCLTPAHERCERLLQFIARTGTAAPGHSTLADGFVSTRMLLAPQPAWRGIAGRARASRTGPILAASAGLAAVGIAGATVASSMLTPSAAVSSAPSATATPLLTTTPSPSQRPSPTPTTVPSPTPLPATPASTPAPTPVPVTPAPTPVPPTTYAVVEGDTLALIAQRFGTTVAALQSANGIEDPDEIVVGQVLVIP